MSYTKGKWEYVEYPQGQIEIIANGDVGGVVHEGQLLTEPEDIAEEKANARLIAAAPDLLDTCKFILAEAIGLSGHIAEMLRQAIAKAEQT